MWSSVIKMVLLYLVRHRFARAGQGLGNNDTALKLARLAARLSVQVREDAAFLAKKLALLLVMIMMIGLSAIAALVWAILSLWNTPDPVLPLAALVAAPLLLAAGVWFYLYTSWKERMQKHPYESPTNTTTAPE